MSGIKKWEKLFYEVKDKRISVKTSQTHWAFFGTPIEWSGMYIKFKDVVFWNGKMHKEYNLHAKWIKEIKYGEHKFD